MTEEFRVDQAAVDITIDLRDGRTPLFDAGEIYTRAAGRYETYLKPVVDRAGALVLGLVLLPVIVGCAIAVLVSMGRPILYRQERVGRFGTTFTLYKFRTMLPDRRVEPRPFGGIDRRVAHKTPDDPRITRVGRLLRSWSLDELPQFWNVLLGHMSLVGPRPEMVDIVARYEPWQHTRHAVKPGITGPWQISERGERMLHECTDMDLRYMDEIGLWTDLKILLLTPFAAFGLRNGY